MKSYPGSILKAALSLNEKRVWSLPKAALSFKRKCIEQFPMNAPETPVGHHKNHIPVIDS